MLKYSFFKNLCFFLLLFSTGKLVAQEESKSICLDKVAIKFNYFGEFILHPGIAGGIEYGLKENKWFKLHLDVDLGAYHHKWNSNGFFSQSTLGTRFTMPLGICFDIHAGYGYLLTTPSGVVYQADESGDLIQKGRPYMSHAKPTMSILLGWNGKGKLERPLIFQTGLELYGQTRFNHSMLPHMALKLGIIYPLKS